MQGDAHLGAMEPRGGVPGPGLGEEEHPARREGEEQEPVGGQGWKWHPSPAEQTG